MFGSMGKAWTPRRQGDAGEASAIQWFLSIGAHVFVPVAHTPSDFDYLIYMDDRVLRVQVKTSTFSSRNDRFDVALRTSGGNQSWSRIVKRMDPSRCDYVFIHVGDGRRWFVPTSELGGNTTIVVGGPKYAEFEVERGQPLQARIALAD